MRERLQPRVHFCLCAVAVLAAEDSRVHWGRQGVGLDERRVCLDTLLHPSQLVRGFLLALDGRAALDGGGGGEGGVQH